MSIPALADAVSTQLGGVLYLINLMVALDLPHCFEAGWRLATGVGPWGLLYALGWELAMQDGAAPGADMSWPALATWTAARRVKRPASPAPWPAANLAIV